MKNTLLVLNITACLILLGGCASEMNIDTEVLGLNPAKLTIASPEIEDYVSIPLLNSKFVKVNLSAEQSCEDKKPSKLGKARLVKGAHIQSFDIPSDKLLYIYAASEENVGGNMFTCYTNSRFVPKPGANYTLHFKPHKSGFGQDNTSCRVDLRQESFDTGERLLIPVESLARAKGEGRKQQWSAPNPLCNADDSSAVNSLTTESSGSSVTTQPALVDIIDVSQ